MDSSERRQAPPLTPGTPQAARGLAAGLPGVEHGQRTPPHVTSASGCFLSLHLGPWHSVPGTVLPARCAHPPSFPHPPWAHPEGVPLQGQGQGQSNPSAQPGLGGSAFLPPLAEQRSGPHPGPRPWAAPASVPLLTRLSLSLEASEGTGDLKLVGPITSSIIHRNDGQRRPSRRGRRRASLTFAFTGVTRPPSQRATDNHNGAQKQAGEGPQETPESVPLSCLPSRTDRGPARAQRPTPFQVCPGHSGDLSRG